MKNLISRIEALEQKINPSPKLMVVIVDKDDESCEAAKARVMREYGIDKVPDDCCTILLNLFGKQIT